MDSGGFWLIYSLATRCRTAKSSATKHFPLKFSLSIFFSQISLVSVCLLRCSRVYVGLCMNSFIYVHFQYFVFYYIKQMCFSAMAKQIFVYFYKFFFSFHIGSLFCKVDFQYRTKKMRKIEKKEEERKKKNAQTEGLVLG